LELIETNKKLQQQLEDQLITIQTSNTKIIDFEAKIHSLEAENKEYRHTINQTNCLYEETLSKLNMVRKNLNNAKDEITEYQTTMKSLNHDILQNANDPQQKYLQQKIEEKYDIFYEEKLKTQQQKYDELLTEFENMRNDINKLEKQNVALNDEITELKLNKVELEKEINAKIEFIEDQNKAVIWLDTNIKALTHFVHNAQNDELRDNLLLNEWTEDEQSDQSDLFTIIKNHDECLMNEEIEFEFERLNDWNYKFEKKKNKLSTIIDNHHQRKKKVSGFWYILQNMIY